MSISNQTNTFIVSIAITLALALPAAAQVCGGDCDQNCAVTVDEILTMVNGALGQVPVASCNSGDTNIDGQLTVDEILAGVSNALQGCNGPPCRILESRCAVPDGTGVNMDAADEACDYLSSHRFFTGRAALQQPNQGVVPYDINTELFTDYANKHRFVWLPPGTAAPYDPRRPFEFPLGTVLIKTFAYPRNQTDPSRGEDMLETRLLVHTAEGWVGRPYVWNADNTDAQLKQIGATLDVAGIQADGEFGMFKHIVPNANQCKGCHRAFDDLTSPIGPNARNLNKDYPYADGAANQLTRWAALGILAGAPADPRDAPQAAVFDEPESGSVAERARSYLDVNCAHCHNPTGPARTSGLFLEFDETNPTRLGLCKQPVAAGRGTGGRSHVVDPGSPDSSILTFRVESDDPEIMMPELGRTRAHAEGLVLIEQWIADMDGECVLE